MFGFDTFIEVRQLKECSHVFGQSTGLISQVGKRRMRAKNGEKISEMMGIRVWDENKDEERVWMQLADDEDF